MKRFTVIFSCLLVIAFAAALAFVALSPDFVPVSGAEQLRGEDDLDAPVWDMSLDDLLSSLEEQGLIDRSTTQLIGTSGLASEGYLISGAEFYWWDLDNLDEDSDEFAAYKSMKEEGIIDVYGSGVIMTLVSNGPFGLLTTRYEGDVDELTAAFEAFGRE